MKKKLSLLLCLAMTLFVMTSSTKITTIFVIGDSTAAEKSNFKDNPERGWGMVLQGFFDDKILVDNHAVNGRSSKSFINEGRWQKVLDRLKPGDYVFIQFGHNDEKPKPDRHTDPGQLSMPICVVSLRKPVRKAAFLYCSTLWFVVAGMLRT